MALEKHLRSTALAKSAVILPEKLMPISRHNAAARRGALRADLGDSNSGRRPSTRL
jgi:hypothetical protein